MAKGYTREDKPKRETYRSVLDYAKHPSGKMWLSGQKYKLYPHEAESELKRGTIVKHDTSPKKFVELHNEDRSVEKLTWGQYLKRRKDMRKK
jgi:hypothetical protein